jgi:hypothetical protein
MHPRGGLTVSLLQKPRAQTGGIRFYYEDVGVSWYALQQLLNMISKPETQYHVYGTFSARYILYQESGFLERIITAMKIKLAAVGTTKNRRRRSSGSRIDE